MAPEGTPTFADMTPVSALTPEPVHRPGWITPAALRPGDRVVWQLDSRHPERTSVVETVDTTGLRIQGEADQVPLWAYIARCELDNTRTRVSGSDPTAPEAVSAGKRTNLYVHNLERKGKGRGKKRDGGARPADSEAPAAQGRSGTRSSAPISPAGGTESPRTSPPEAVAAGTPAASCEGTAGRVCIDCGVSIADRHNTAKRCVACASKHYTVAHRAAVKAQYYQQKAARAVGAGDTTPATDAATPPAGGKACLDCGAPLPAHPATRTRCPECYAPYRRARQAAALRVRYQAKKSARGQNLPSSSVLSVPSVVKAPPPEPVLDRTDAQEHPEEPEIVECGSCGRAMVPCADGRYACRRCSQVPALAQGGDRTDTTHTTHAAAAAAGGTPPAEAPAEAHRSHRSYSSYSSLPPALAASPDYPPLGTAADALRLTAGLVIDRIQAAKFAQAILEVAAQQSAAILQAAADEVGAVWSACSCTHSPSSGVQNREDSAA